MGVRWTDAFGNGAVHEDVCMEMKPKTKQKTKKQHAVMRCLKGSPWPDMQAASLETCQLTMPVGTPQLGGNLLQLLLMRTATEGRAHLRHQHQHQHLLHPRMVRLVAQRMVVAGVPRQGTRLWKRSTAADQGPLPHTLAVLHLALAVHWPV